MANQPKVLPLTISFTQGQQKFNSKQIKSPTKMQSLFQFHQYKISAGQYNIHFKGVALVLIPAILISLQFKISSFFQIPTLEYTFVTILISFIGNYYIIRKYELYPYLPQQQSDKYIKVVSLIGVISILLAIRFGWNGSGGIIFGIIWQYTRGKKMEKLVYGFLIILVGSTLLQDNHILIKLIQLIPGILFGYIYSVISIIKDASNYTIYHQFGLISIIFLPMFFPIQHLIRPSLFQWIIMAFGSLITQFIGLITIKMMQVEKTSIGMILTSSILIIGTSSYLQGMEYFYGIIILMGVILIIKRHYLQIND